LSIAEFASARHDKLAHAFYRRGKSAMPDPLPQHAKSGRRIDPRTA